MRGDLVESGGVLMETRGDLVESDVLMETGGVLMETRGDLEKSNVLMETGGDLVGSLGVLVETWVDLVGSLRSSDLEMPVSSRKSWSSDPAVPRTKTFRTRRILVSSVGPQRAAVQGKTSSFSLDGTGKAPKLI